MPRAEYRFVETRWGRERKDGRRKPMFYFRPRRDEKRGKQLPGPKGSPEFVAEYNKRLAAYLANPTAMGARGPRRSDPYTIGWAFDEYKKSSAWLHGTLGETTRGQRDAILYELRKEIGAEPLKLLNRESIETALKRRAATPHRANHVLKTLRHFGDWAATSEIDGHRIINKNPCEGVKPIRAPKTQRSEFNPDAEDGHITWSEEDIAEFEAKWPVGTRQRLVFAVLLSTGLRISDAAALGRQHIQTDGSLMVRTQKNGKRVYLGVRKALRAALDAGPHGKPGVLSFITSDTAFPTPRRASATGFATMRSGRSGSSSARRMGFGKRRRDGSLNWERTRRRSTPSSVGAIHAWPLITCGRPT
jgi:integrase